MAEFYPQNFSRIIANGIEKPLVEFYDKQSGQLIGVWKKPFTLSFCKMPVGVRNYTISKNGVVIVDSPQSEGSVVVHYGDNLQIFAIADTNYAQPTATLSQIQVTGDVVAKVVAGAYTPPQDEICSECGEKGYHWCGCCGSWHDGSCW